MNSGTARGGAGRRSAAEESASWGGKELLETGRRPAAEEDDEEELELLEDDELEEEGGALRNPRLGSRKNSAGAGRRTVGGGRARNCWKKNSSCCWAWDQAQTISFPAELQISFFHLLVQARPVRRFLLPCPAGVFSRQQVIVQSGSPCRLPGSRTPAGPPRQAGVADDMAPVGIPVQTGSGGGGVEKPGSHESSIIIGGNGKGDGRVRWRKQVAEP